MRISALLQAQGHAGKICAERCAGSCAWICAERFFPGTHFLDLCGKMRRFTRLDAPHNGTRKIMTPLNQRGPAVQGADAK